MYFQSKNKHQTDSVEPRRQITAEAENSSMDYRAEELKDSNASDWEQTNQNNIDGTLFHTLRWKQTLERSFGFKAHYFLIYRNNRPVALCPFYQRTMRGFLGLVSLPDAAVNPYDHLIVTDKDSLPLTRILRKCVDIARIHDLSFVAFGVREDLAWRFLRLGVPLHFAGGNMILDLDENPPDRIWRQFSRKLRKGIRRFDRQGYVLDEVSSTDDLEKFYRFYQTNLNRIGANPHPVRHFEELMRAYSGRSPPELMWTLLRRNEEVAGGLLSLLCHAKRTMYMRYLSLNRAIPAGYTPSYYLDWHAVRKASELGCRIVNFGGTSPDPDDVRRRMKAKFGCRYEKRYMAILPSSTPFKFAYYARRFLAGDGFRGVFRWNNFLKKRASTALN